jgi:hypothetical protein
MARSDPHFRLRIPPELKAVIEIHAKYNQRSINAEIVHALEQYFPKPKTSDTQMDIVRLLEGIADRGGPNAEDTRYRAQNLREFLARHGAEDEPVLPPTLSESYRFQRDIVADLTKEVARLKAKMGDTR